MEKNTPSGSEGEDVLGGCRGQHGDLAAPPGHGLRRGGLDAQVHGGDLVADRDPVRRGHHVGGLRGDLPGQVGADHLRAGQDPLEQRVRVRGPVAIPARIAPRSRRCRVSARVPVIAIPVMPWRRSSLVQAPLRPPVRGQTGGPRTTYPLTQIRRDSGSSSFTPVLPMCGAVIATIWRA